MCPMRSETSGPRLLTLLAVAAAVAVVCVAPAVTASLRVEDEAKEVAAAAALFSSFKQQYGKTYATPEEEAHRLRVFRENMEDAKRMNAANPHATFGVTEFSDLALEEFRTRYASGAKHLKEALRDAEPAVNVTGTAPSSVDWRWRGAVTPVKRQGPCGSCWAFATIGVIEGQTKIVDGELKALSEQQLVSCDKLDDACDGGLMDNAFKFIVNKNKGIVYTESSWKYESWDGFVPACNTKDRVVGAKVGGYEVLPQSEKEIAKYLARKGPVAIAIDITHLHQYKGGVVTQCFASGPDHAVLLVGYEDVSLPAYWIIKNSYGKYWGEDGYLRIKKGDNTCFVKSHAVAARLAS